MLELHDYFPELIGQAKTRGSLNFYLQGQNLNQVMPPILLTGQRGCGKSMIARSMAGNIQSANSEPRRCIEVNGSALNKLENFITEIIVKTQQEEITLFIDEISECAKEVNNWLLSVLQPNKDYKSQTTYADQQFIFDYSKFSFIAATTRPNKLTEDLKNRLKRIELEPYTPQDLVKILKLNSPDIKYSNGVDKDIVTKVRESPRTTVSLAQDIIDYCAQLHKKTFTQKDWDVFQKILDIKPLGITTYEMEILKLLHDRGPQSLTAIAAKLKLDPSTVRRDCELFLLSEGLIKLGQKRVISQRGEKVLKEYMEKINER